MDGCIYRTKDCECDLYAEGGKYTAFCDMENCKERKPSNADRIRNMTDEELGEWLYKMRSRLACIPDIQIEKCAKATDCKKCYLEWVKMEGESKCSTDTGESQKAGVSTAQQRQW